MNVSGSPVSSSEKASARASTWRESWLETIVITGTTMAIAERDGGHRAGAGGRVAAEAAGQLARAPTSRASATIASQISPLRRSW